MASSQSDLERFFGKYPEFDYKPGRNAAREFQRLAREKGWSQAEKVLRKMKDKEETQPKKKMSPEKIQRLKVLKREYGDARTKFYGAFQKEFNAVFDRGYLCEVLGFEVPETGLKKMLQTVHVNIYELHHYEKALRKGKSAKIVDVNPEVLRELLSTETQQPQMRKSKSMAHRSSGVTDIEVETSGDIIMFRFSKVSDLAVYSRENDLIYPLKRAKEEGALKLLLRRIVRGNRPSVRTAPAV